jgi:ubiquinone/menaquinone biosynthesis C-methylase UbiE
MLPRILEPEVMDSLDEARDYDSMDHFRVNEIFVDDFFALEHFPDEVLDVGVGTARIPIGLCKRHKKIRVVGIDLAVSMLQIAEVNVELANLRERILLDRQDAKRLTFDNHRFGAVISNSIVHHIPEPLQVLTESIRVLKPGGLLFFRDLLRPQNNLLVEQLVETYAADEDEHARQMFEASLRAALSLEEILDFVTSLGFAAETVRATSDRHWTWSARQKN